MAERDLRALYAYLNADEKTQVVVREMVGLIDDAKVNDKKNESARRAILYYLFPSAALKDDARK